MRRLERWIVSCAVLWLSACSTLPRPVVLDHDNAARRQAAVQTRWIGVTRFGTGTCPVPRTSDWKVSPLVPPNRLEPGLEKSLRKAKLSRFCVYEYKGAAPVSRQLTLPPEISARLRSVEPDRLALSGMGLLEETTAPLFSQLFQGQVQMLNNLPADGTSRIRLAFLDTQPTGEGFPALDAPRRSQHGYTLAHIAGHLAGALRCGDVGSNPCAVEVATRLALPVVRFDPVTGTEVERDTASGGFRGTFYDLSQALLDEVDDWLSRPAEERPSHLVLNLSAGWDGEKFGGWEEDLADMTPDIWAVYGALKAAADQGVLVIAAAGNERGGPAPTGQPLLPGGWEKPFRLSKDNEWVWKSPDAPLIYAASGIDGWDHPLVNTRRSGEAPWVAYADHVAVADLHDPTKYTATLTGSSVAAAVVSTIAAVVWSYSPDLPPAQLMETLYRSGEPLPRKHDFSASLNAEPYVRRITLCRAVEKAWSTSNTRPLLSCGAKLVPERIDLGAFEAPGGALAQTEPPFQIHPDAQDQPLVDTQPAMDPCPSCAVDPDGRARLAPLPEIATVANLAPLPSSMLHLGGSYRLLIEVPDGWGELQEATLEIFGFDPVTGRREAEPLSGSSIGTVQGGDALEVSFSPPAEPFQAALSFVLAPPAGAPEGTPPLSIVSPLYINGPGGTAGPDIVTTLN